MRKLNQNSVFLGLFIAVIPLIFAVNYYLQVNRLRFNYAEILILRELQLRDVLVLSKTFGEQNRMDTLHDRLEDLRKAHFIDFYILQYQDQPVWYGTADGKLEPINQKYTEIENPVRANGATYETLAFGNDFHLTMGFGVNFDKFAALQLDDFRGFMWVEVFMFGGAALLAALWSFRDLILVFFKFRKGDFKGAGQVKSKSMEADMIMRGLSGYSETVDDIGANRDLLSKQVMPSLKNELLSGQIPPYDFNCTLARIDINNFSEIYNKHDVRLLMQTINEFFVEVSDIITRYDGLVHEFIGDEVIFFFKESTHPNSFLTALSATRDIIRVAEKYDAFTKRERGYPFTVKSSLAYGSLHFGPLVDGMGLAGAILIETVRVLNVANDKSIHTVYFDQRHLDSLDHIAIGKEALKTTLKGYQGERVIAAYHGHRDLIEILEESHERGFGALTYFRSDTDLLKGLSWLKGASLTESQLVSAVEVLKKIRVAKPNSKLTNFMMTWVKDLVSEPAPDWHVVSALLNIIPNFIPQAAFNDEINAYFLELLEMIGSRDSRSVANLIEAMAHFGSVAKLKSKTHSRYFNLRIDANNLIREAKVSIESKTTRKLRKLIRSKDVAAVASGVFAIGEVASFHIHRDKVYFRTRVQFLELLNEVPALVQIKNDSVRRQVFAAVQKLGDPDLLSQLETEVRKLNEPLLLEAFSRHFNRPLALLNAA